MDPSIKSERCGLLFGKISASMAVTNRPVRWGIGKVLLGSQLAMKRRFF
jgi:hypothetical protein